MNVEVRRAEDEFLDLGAFVRVDEAVDLERLEHLGALEVIPAAAVNRQVEVELAPVLDVEADVDAVEVRAPERVGVEGEGRAAHLEAREGELSVAATGAPHAGQVSYLAVAQDEVEHRRVDLDRVQIDLALHERPEGRADRERVGGREAPVDRIVEDDPLGANAGRRKHRHLDVGELRGEAQLVADGLDRAVLHPLPAPLRVHHHEGRAEGRSQHENREE